jgi:hypothetical protein
MCRFHFSSVLYSQEVLVSRTVISSDDKYITSGDTIFIKSKDVATIADFDGIYLIPIITKNKIIFNYLGFKPKRLLLLIYI